MVINWLEWPGAGASAEIELPPPTPDDIVIYVPISVKRPPNAPAHENQNSFPTGSRRRRGGRRIEGGLPETLLRQTEGVRRARLPCVKRMPAYLQLLRVLQGDLEFYADEAEAAAGRGEPKGGSGRGPGGCVASPARTGPEGGAVKAGAGLTGWRGRPW
jgi:hypothetical protein